MTNNRDADPLNVAIVGAGNIAGEHLAVWEKTSGVKVIAVCDVNFEAARRMAAICNAKPYDDLSELLKKEGVKVVDICTPPGSHSQLALMAMGAGCHVLLEKPMAMNSVDAGELLRAQGECGVKLGVMHNWLFGNVVWRAHRLVESGAIGTVLNVNIQMVDTSEDEMIADPHHWCHALPGGRFGECLIHPVYLVQAFVGPTRVETVVADKRGPHPWVNADEVQITLKGDKGIGSIYSSFNAPRKMVIIELFGTSGILRVDMISHSMIQMRSRGSARTAKLLGNLSQAGQLVDSSLRSALHYAKGGSQSGHPRYIKLFADALQANTPEPVTPLEAYQAVETLEEICARLDRSVTPVDSLRMDSSVS